MNDINDLIQIIKINKCKTNTCDEEKINLNKLITECNRHNTCFENFNDNIIRNECKIDDEYNLKCKIYIYPALPLQPYRYFKVCDKSLLPWLDKVFSK